MDVYKCLWLEIGSHSRTALENFARVASQLTVHMISLHIFAISVHSTTIFA